jgi:hypothetical protein
LRARNPELRTENGSLSRDNGSSRRDNGSLGAGNASLWTQNNVKKPKKLGNKGEHGKDEFHLVPNFSLSAFEQGKTGK